MEEGLEDAATGLINQRGSGVQYAAFIHSDDHTVVVVGDWVPALYGYLHGGSPDNL
jgi:hypothetical protein